MVLVKKVIKTKIASQLKVHGIISQKCGSQAAYFPKVAGARCMLMPKVSQSFTPNAHQVLLLKAPPLGGRATTPWYSPSILFHIMSSLECFPPPCCHHTGVINQLAKTRYLNVSARYRLITTNRSNLTMNIWMHHI